MTRISGHTRRPWRAAALLAVLAVFATPLRSAESCFRIFDATVYAGRPDLAGVGIERLSVVEPERWWQAAGAVGSEAKRTATIGAVRALAALPGRLVLDLELADDGTMEGRAAVIGEYRAVAQWVRDAGYAGSLGYYSLLPPRSYWGAVARSGSTEATAWQRGNDEYRVIGEVVDAFYPSLYTFYDDQNGWRRYAIASVAESRRADPDIPVYPFIWPQYHNSNAMRAYEYLDETYWRLQLETLYAVADGVVIWGGWDFARWRAAEWDASLTWWRVLQQFMQAHPGVCRTVTGQ
jgi:hypothetical protein